MLVRAWGGGGGGRLKCWECNREGAGCNDYNYYAGGAGGYMSAMFKVQPGQKYYAVTGGGGESACENNAVERGGDGGAWGGGFGTNGDSTPGGGGGYSGVFHAATPEMGFSNDEFVQD